MGESDSVPCATSPSYGTVGRAVRGVVMSGGRLARGRQREEGLRWWIRWRWTGWTAPEWAAWAALGSFMGYRRASVGPWAVCGWVGCGQRCPGIVWTAAFGGCRGVSGERSDGGCCLPCVACTHPLGCPLDSPRTFLLCPPLLLSQSHCRRCDNWLTLMRTHHSHHQNWQGKTGM